MSVIIKPAKLLLVDDKPSNLLALEAVLGAVGYELVFAHSGEEALKLLEQHHDIALILLDVQMPDLDGYEVAKRVKAMPNCRDIPIVFITAIYNDDPFVAKGYEVGAIDYFSKPFDSEILKTKVGIYASFRQKAELVKEKERQVKELDELLRASRKLSGILESLPMGVIVVDVDRKVCQVNKEGLQYWKSFEDSDQHPNDGSAEWWNKSDSLPWVIEEPMMEALKVSHDSHNEYFHRYNVDGATKSIFVSASPLHGPSGNLLGTVVVIQDVTPRKSIEDDLEQRINHLVS